MMTKNKTTKFARLKLLFVFPLALSMMLVISFSSDAIAQTEEKVAPPPPPKEAASVDKPIKAEKKPKQITVIEVEGEQEEPPIFTVVEDMPKFPGGNKAMYAFLGENIKYPDVAKQEGYQGKVFVTFVVEKDGSVSNVKLVRGVHESLDKEAMRVIKIMPKWEPGTQRGKAVRVQYTLPIKFTLDKGKSEEKAE